MASTAAIAREARPKWAKEQIVLAPEERCETVLQVVRSARQRLILSLFRCDDFRVLDELAEALQRGVQVEVLLTRRAKGWRKRLKQLWKFIGSMGAKVYRYQDPVVRYHAKYIVADDGPALVASLNFTQKCFTQTCDFLHLTYDPAVVSGLHKLFEVDCEASESCVPDGVTERLIVGPQRAREQLTSLLEGARKSIRVIDHKVTDPTIITLLRAKKEEGVSVEVLGRRRLSAAKLAPHGKLFLVDGSTAVIGSISLSALAMDFRREVALLIRDRRCVRQLNDFFQDLAARAPVRPRAQSKSANRKGKKG